MYFHGTWTQWSLGRDTCDLNRSGVKGHLEVNDLSSFFKKGHCIHILWCIFVGLGHNDPWVESHMWPQQMWGQRSSRGQQPPWFKFFCKKGHCIHILWCIFIGLGHNDPWIESHIRPQQMWGQRSSRGQWLLVQVFVKTVTVSTYFDVFSGETCGSRTTLLVMCCNLENKISVKWFRSLRTC